MKTSFTICLLFFSLITIPKTYAQDSLFVDENSVNKTLWAYDPKVLIVNNGTFSSISLEEKKKLSFKKSFWGKYTFYEGETIITGFEFAKKLSSNRDTYDLFYKSYQQSKYSGITAGISFFCLIGSIVTNPNGDNVSVLNGRIGWTVPCFTMLAVASYLSIKGSINNKASISLYNEKYAQNTYINSSINGFSLSLAF
jgi:hypothetical protein